MNFFPFWGSEFTVWSVVRVAQSLISYVVFNRSLFVILSFLFWPWYPIAFSCSLTTTKYLQFYIDNFSVESRSSNFNSKEGQYSNRINYVWSVVRVAQSLIFYVVFYRSLFVILSFLFWPWYRMSFWIVLHLITPLISSKFSLKDQQCSYIIVALLRPLNSYSST
jgi:hypothetical protein